MATEKVIGRFAPSPTGPLHFGSLIAALGSYLDAKSRGGDWLVRIEDLDPPREQAGATNQILRTLESYGFEWDGPVMYQSKRHHIYRQGIERLFEQNLAYYCTCSRKTIAKYNKPELKQQRYPGTCRSHSKPIPDAAIRVLTTNNVINFEDRLQNHITCKLEEEYGDFIIKRKDELFAYHLAVVLDDADQGITDIVRGADLIDSTTHHIYLQQLLNLPTPRYLHLPVAVNKAGKKLSKQTHAEPLDRQDISRTLITALLFLNQKPGRDLVEGTPSDVISWAIRHWCLENIPASRKIKIY